MKDFIQDIYKYLFQEDLLQIKEVVIPCPPPPIPPKTTGEKFLELVKTYKNIDPTPKDIQSDEYACAEVMTTLLKIIYPETPIITYTPLLLKYMQGSLRFLDTKEFKPGVIIISPTATGNGSIVGHVGVIGENGKIWSNDSLTGLWKDKYDCLSWIERYSRQGKLSMYLFELI